MRDIVKRYLKFLNEEQVNIPVEKGDLGLSLDDPIEKYKEKLNSKKEKWGEMSKQLNTLYIFNKNKNPDVAKKAKKIRNSLAKYVETKRQNEPEFSK